MPDKTEGILDLKMDSMFLSGVACTSTDILSPIHKQWDALEPRIECVRKRLHPSYTLLSLLVKLVHNRNQEDLAKLHIAKL